MAVHPDPLPVSMCLPSQGVLARTVRRFSTPVFETLQKKIVNRYASTRKAARSGDRAYRKTDLGLTQGLTTDFTDYTDKESAFPICVIRG